MLPQHITFTGVDEHTSPAGMASLSARYPIEWGILFSPSRQGAGRYPPLDWLRTDLLAEATWEMRFSAHLCGGHAQTVLERGLVNGGGLQHLITTYCERVQINATEYPERLTPALQFQADVMGAPLILQCRGAFPADERVSWLFDQSGGRGKTPKEWPLAPSSEVLCGYAGGITPHNGYSRPGRPLLSRWAGVSLDCRGITYSIGIVTGYPGAPVLPYFALSEVVCIGGRRHRLFWIPQTRLNGAALHASLEE